MLLFVFALLFCSGTSAFNSKRLLSKLGECGSWNNLADFDCTDAPKLKVLYTKEKHELKMRMISQGVTPEIHAHLLATNHSYALINDAEYINTMEKKSDSLREAITINSPLHSNDMKSVGLTSTRLRGMVLPTWTNIPPGSHPSSKNGTTYSAEVNTGNFIITSASGGTVLTFSACGVGSSGDTYIRLVDKNDKQLAFDDDSCGTAGGSSTFTYTVPGPVTNTPTMTFKIGCFSTFTCMAKVTITGISSLSLPSFEPTVSPSSKLSVSSRSPTFRATSGKPSGKPSAKPSGKPSAKPSVKPSAKKTSVKPFVKPSRRPTTVASIVPSAPVMSKAPTNVVLPYNLEYNGGKISQVAVVKLIFWGSSWVSAPGDMIYGMDLFYKGWTGSGYANIQTEYSGTNGQVTNAINYQGYVVDSSTPTGIDQGIILNEVCAQISDPDPFGEGFYVVYTELKRGSAGYCGWHSYSYCGDIPVQFAFIFNLDGDSGCIAGSPPANPGWQMSNAVHALASVSAHELAEMVTDPDLITGWYDINGLENADKCAWTFADANQVFSNGITWRLHGEWSNAAAIAKTGYATSHVDGETVYGCLGAA